MRKVYLVLKEGNIQDEQIVCVPLVVTNSKDSVETLIKKATDDFLATKEGKDALEETCGNFNYGDFVTYVSNKYCQKYGFSKLDDDMDNVVSLCLNESLI